MKSNDNYPHADIEIQLAELLASSANRDLEDVEIIERIMGLEVDDDAIELLQEGCIEVALDKIADREAPPPRPRSWIESMVDRACGVPWA